MPHRPKEETLIAFGDRVRIEKRFKAEPDGSHLWVAYELVDVGLDHIHPVTKTSTKETAVWIISGVGPETQMRTLARKLSRMQ